MPTYTNTGSGPISVVNASGVPVILQPGESSETLKFYSIEGLALISESPVWTRLVSRTEVDLDTPGENAPDPAIDGFDGAVVDIDPDTAQVFLMKISDTVTAYRQTVSADPELVDWTDEDPVIGIDAAGTMTKLYLSGAGNVEVFQYRRGL